jgi:hypothetical protein
VTGNDESERNKGFYSDEQKSAYPRTPDHNCAHGLSSDLVKIQRELELPSLNSPKGHYTISQTVSSSLIHLIQQLDGSPISEAIV